MSKQALAEELLSTFSSLIDFSIGIIYKDTDLANLTESNDSLIQSTEYINYKLTSEEGANHPFVIEYEEDTLIRYEYETRNELPPAGVRGELNKYYSQLYSVENVDIMEARLARDFQIIKYPTGLISEIAAKLFVEEHTKNLEYFMQVMWTDGFGNGEDYRKFVRFFINFMTIQSMMDKLYDNQINIELINEWTANNLLYSHGIYFLDHMTLNHKRRVIKKLNELLMYKGSNRVFETIFGIFGFTNINSYRYYITKNYPLDSDGNPILNVSPELKALRIPHSSHDPEKFWMEASEEERLSAVTEIDDLFKGDETWMVTKEEILEKEFSLLQTKYFDVEAAMNVLSRSLDVTYLFNLVRIATKDPYFDRLEFSATDVSPNPIKLIDAIVASTMISLKVMGYDALPPIEPSDIRTVYSFRRKVDNVELSTNFDNFFSRSAYKYLTDGNITDPRDLDVFKQVFKSNIDFKTEMEKVITEATNVNDFENLMQDYDTLFKSKVITDIFGSSETYEDYLERNDINLLNFINSALLEPEGIRDTVLRRSLNILLQAIERYISDIDVSIENLSLDYVMSYIRELINVFKAYSIQLKDMHIFYLVDSPFNRLFMFDDKGDTDLKATKAELVKFYSELKGMGIKSIEPIFLSMLDEINSVLFDKEESEISFSDILHSYMEKTEAVLIRFKEQIDGSGLTLVSSSSTVEDNFFGIVTGAKTENIGYNDSFSIVQIIE